MKILKVQEEEAVLGQQNLSNKGVIYNRDNYTITRKDEVFLNVAKEISNLSTCISMQVGCVIVNENRIISMGYNGTPSGVTHCEDIFFDDKKILDEKEFRKKHHAWSLLNEVHAEINAILYAAKKGIAINDSILYCTLMPCNNCLKAICASGIKKVYYSDIYDRTRFTPNIITLLRKSGIKLIYCGDTKFDKMVSMLIDEFDYPPDIAKNMVRSADNDWFIKMPI